MGGDDKIVIDPIDVYGCVICIRVSAFSPSWCGNPVNSVRLWVDGVPLENLELDGCDDVSIGLEHGGVSASHTGDRIFEFLECVPLLFFSLFLFLVEFDECYEEGGFGYTSFSLAACRAFCFLVVGEVAYVLEDTREAKGAFPGTNHLDDV